MKENSMAPIAIWSEFCAVAPHPALKERMKAELNHARGSIAPGAASLLGLAKKPKLIGLDDGVIIPPEQFPPGTSLAKIRSAAADRAPLRGTIRVIVVLVDFSDKTMGQTTTRFNDLFFSTGVLPHGSVKEYYKEVTGNLIDITGEVRGPYRMPQTMAWYANNNFGIGQGPGDARANIMAQDAATAADADVNYAPYDNDGNGYVDAFVVIHAGSGGEETGNSGDIWSHKWTLPSEYTADNTKIYAYLTIPEDCRLGVCAHELGHLLFGFPDLYDTDYTSEGIGNWCLMAGGSWNGPAAGAQAGDIPAHPSAWCKVNQGWATVTNVTSAGTLTFPDVKTSRNVNRLWTDGAGGNEYFLVENRQRSGYDAGLPGDGLLVWHIDESQSGNTDENHYKVGLVQADGKRDLELDHNRGDGGDPYPGSSNNTSLTDSSTPNSKSYAGANTDVSISNITASAATMTASVEVGVHLETPHVVLFEHANFHGAHKHVLSEETNLNAADDSFFNDRVSSLAILHGSWSFFRDAGYGNPYPPTLGPGSYSWVEAAGIKNDDMSSLRVADRSGSPTLPHVILFEHANFHGAHKHVFGWEPNLAASDDKSFNDKVSSIIVLAGDWIFFKDVGYANQYPRILGPGLYPWVEAVGIKNDDLSSLHPMSLAGVITAPHVILFEHANFHGAHKHVLSAEPNLAAGDDSFFNDRTSSIAVLSGSWAFYKDINFQNQYPGILPPGIYSWVEAVGITNDNMSSLRPV